MTKWVRCFWSEESVWFYFELDVDGNVTRQVEIRGPGDDILAAASLGEWQDAHAAGELAGYEAVYGRTAELPFSEWEGHNPEWLTGEDFESVWASARRRIQARHR